ncbi:ABC transporter [Candidatus Frankia nodulisporulans]|uniref:ABC transporter n=1 Tax=Candidatus Frankia nodulisporulans TaxID=2060052 RepID=UPI0013D809A2|nr:ABC transporter [Candidatus Frankia nodulisporulans]
MNGVRSTWRSLRAELVKVWRPSTAVATGLLAALSVLSTVLVLSLADDPAPSGGPPAPGPGDGPAGFAVTTAQLTAASGIARGFAGGSTFTGLLVFLVVAIAITLEYGQGTLRTLFLREPRRLGWLAGRMILTLALVAVALVAALVLSVAAAVVTAGIRGIDTSAWWSVDGVRALATSYRNALLASAFFSVVGTALGVALRSTAVTLAAGVAWMFPLEHIIEASWNGAGRVFPGLVFDAVGQGGVADVSYGDALLVGTAYALGAAALAALTLTRRDITS